VGARSCLHRTSPHENGKTKRRVPRSAGTVSTAAAPPLSLHPALLKFAREGPARLGARPGRPPSRVRALCPQHEQREPECSCFRDGPFGIPRPQESHCSTRTATACLPGAAAAPGEIGMTCLPSGGDICCFSRGRLHFAGVAICAALNNCTPQHVRQFFGSTSTLRIGHR